MLQFELNCATISTKSMTQGIYNATPFWECSYQYEELYYQSLYEIDLATPLASGIINLGSDNIHAVAYQQMFFLQCVLVNL